MTGDTPTLDAFHEKGRELLYLQMRNIDALIHELAPPQANGGKIEVDNDIRIIVWMLQAIGVSINSVLKLTESRDMSIRDCFGIARSAAETAVNIAFIAVSDPAVTERAIQHMRQKRWRDLKRTGRIGKRNFSVSRKIKASITDFPGLEDALAEFTTKKGSEIRDWTPETIEQRIGIIEQKSEKAGLLLASSIFSIYRPSSELLHGTFYGVNYFWQGSRDEPVTSREAFEHLWMHDHFITLLSSLLFAVSGAIYAVATGRQLQAHFAEQERMLALLRGYTERIADTDLDSEHEAAVS
ncbi:DUF5677 domain-containing protein [Phyllobacterium phragmitis]|uniref:AbiV family abortive infection protein n=1 Tax=Phyllobacterium phragmitis TaxID=2670329 RepID=A0ABQ0H129_9HYPH